MASTSTRLFLLLLSAILTLAADTPFPGYPSPWATAGTATTTNNNNNDDSSWAAAYAKAVDFVAGLTLTEKVNLTTGTGWEADRCVGNTGGVPRLGFRGMCMMDGPLGVRASMFISFFSFFALKRGRGGSPTWSV